MKEKKVTSLYESTTDKDKSGKIMIKQETSSDDSSDISRKGDYDNETQSRK